MPQISEHDTLFRFEKELGWEFIPEKEGAIVYKGGIQHSIKINKEGFRDVSFSEKTKNHKIMLLGDSFVSNISVANQDAVFSQRMEKELAGTSVYNLGVNGYGQIQEYQLLKKWYPKIKPDLIVVLVYLRNDFTDNSNKNLWLYSRPSVIFNTDGEMKIIPPSGEVRKKKERPFYYKSHLYRLVNNSISNIKAKKNKEASISIAPPETYTCSKPFSSEVVEMYHTTQQLLLEIDAYGKSMETPVLFALAPSMFQVEDALWSQIEDYDTSLHLERDLPNKTLLSFAKENDLDMIDLMPALQKEEKQGVKMYHTYEQHWTPEGNRVVTEVLSKYIKEKNNK